MVPIIHPMAGAGFSLIVVSTHTVIGVDPVSIAPTISGQGRFLPDDHRHHPRPLRQAFTLDSGAGKV